MIKIRFAKERGHTEIGWLDSYHTFSFGDYYNPKHMNFGHLRVINEDRVKPGEGFGTHGHRDMEIITYVFEGALEHQDSLGNGSIIKAGDVQAMSAGTGVTHSEFNASKADPVHFLQMWVVPNQQHLQPRYEQKTIVRPDKQNEWHMMVSPDGQDGSITIHQNVFLYQAFLAEEKEISYPLAPNRQAWLQVICGTVTLNGKTLYDGDGASIQDEKVTLKAHTASEVILFDLEKSNEYIEFEGD